MLQNTPLALLACLLSAAAWQDAKTSRIPNIIVYPGALAGIALNTALMGGHGLLTSVEGMLLGLGALRPLYAIRAAGAGDAKLMAMVGAFLGPLETIGAVFSTFVAGALIGLAWALRRGVLAQTLRNMRVILWSFYAKFSAADGPGFDPATQSVMKIPYALAIAGGTLAWVACRRFA